MDSLFDTFSGLPVHALVVHAVGVLVPLSAIGAILMAASPAFSRRFGTIVVLLAGIGAVTSIVAKLSGEQLAERVGTPDPHASLGSVMPYFAIGLFILVLVLWLVDRGIPANKSRPLWLIVSRSSSSSVRSSRRGGRFASATPAHGPSGSRSSGALLASFRRAPGHVSRRRWIGCGSVAGGTPRG